MRASNTRTLTGPAATPDCSQCVVRLIVGSFAVQVQVKSGKQRGKAVRIFEIHGSAAEERCPDSVWTRFAIDLRDKQSMRVFLCHRHALVRQNDLGGLGVRAERGHFPARRGAGFLIDAGPEP